MATLTAGRSFLDRAKEYERMAGEATTAEVRETLLHLGSRWRSLADDDEKTSKETSEIRRIIAPGPYRNSRS